MAFQEVTHDFDTRLENLDYNEFRVHVYDFDNKNIFDSITLLYNSDT